jgi:hypothetical protein
MRAYGGATPGILLIAVAALITGCGSSAPAVLRGDPAGYLISLDQLTSPDFTVYQAPGPVGAGWLDSGSATQIRQDGLAGAAEVEYYRAVWFPTSNGPITLTAAVASFATPPGAAAAMTRLDGALDARAGAIQVSTGSLGDESHAITLQATVESVPAVEIVVVWRVDNLVNSLVAQGRFGGLQLDQVLPLATTQTSNELRASA